MLIRYSKKMKVAVFGFTIVFAPNALLATLPGLLEFRSASRSEFAQLKEACQISFGFRSSDQLLETQRHYIYRLSRSCVKGKRAAVCPTFIFSKESQCVEQFYSTGSGLQLDLPLNDVISPFPASKLIELPFVLETRSGEVVIFETQDELIVLRIE